VCKAYIANDLQSQREFAEVILTFDHTFKVIYGSAVMSSLGILLRQMFSLIRVVRATDAPFPAKSSSSDEVLIVLLLPKCLRISHSQMPYVGVYPNY